MIDIKGILNDAVVRYALMQRRINELVEKREEALDKIRTAKHYIEREKIIKENKTESIKIRQEIDTAALAAAYEFETKDPHEAVKIKEYDEIQEIEHEAAVAWCIENAPKFIKLDKAQLKKYAIGAIKAGAPLPFIKVEKTKKVFLSKNFEKFATM